MNAVERMVEYTSQPTEGAAQALTQAPPPGWPQAGAIIIDNLQVSPLLLCDKQHCSCTPHFVPLVISSVPLKPATCSQCWTQELDALKMRLLKLPWCPEHLLMQVFGFISGHKDLKGVRTAASVSDSYNQYFLVLPRWFIEVASACAGAVQR